MTQPIRPGSTPGRPNPWLQRQLPRIPKRPRPVADVTEADDWGGGQTELAPLRRERGQWDPPKAPRAMMAPSRTTHWPRRAAPVGTTLPFRSKRSDGKRQEYDHSSKKAKHDHLGGPFVGPGTQAPDGGSEASSDGLSDRPRQVTPPPDLSWKSPKPGQAVDGGTLGRSSAEDKRTTESRRHASALSLDGREPHRQSFAKGQLPADHPLKVHLARLQSEREKRKLQWAGLIDALGDEFRNPASHDRSLWLQEEQKADNAIAETMLQIKVAENELLPDIPQSAPRGPRHESQGQARGRGIGSRSRYGRRGSRGSNNRGAGRGRANIYPRGGPNGVPLHKQDFHGQLHPNFRARKQNAPSKTPMRWDEQRKEDAVRSWLDEMGMSTGEGSDRFRPSEGRPCSRNQPAQGADVPRDEDAMSFISLGASEESRHGISGDVERIDMTDEVQVRIDLARRYGVTSLRAVSDEANDFEGRIFETVQAAREQEQYKAAVAMENAGAVLEQSEALQEPAPGSSGMSRDHQGDEDVVVKEDLPDTDDESILILGVDGYRVVASPLPKHLDALPHLRAASNDAAAPNSAVRKQWLAALPTRSSTGQFKHQQLTIKGERAEDLLASNKRHKDICGRDDGFTYEVDRNDPRPRLPSAAVSKPQAHDQKDHEGQDDDEGELMLLEDSSSEEEDTGDVRLDLPPAYNDAAAANEAASKAKATQPVGRLDLSDSGPTSSSHPDEALQQPSQPMKGGFGTSFTKDLDSMKPRPVKPNARSNPIDLQDRDATEARIPSFQSTHDDGQEEEMHRRLSHAILEFLNDPDAIPGGHHHHHHHHHHPIKWLDDDGELDDREQDHQEDDQPDNQAHGQEQDDQGNDQGRVHQALDRELDNEEHDQAQENPEDDREQDDPERDEQGMETPTWTLNRDPTASPPVLSSPSSSSSSPSTAAGR